MGFLSATQSLSRYHIADRFETEPMEQVRNGLIRHAIPTMENEYEEISAGWAPFESPYLPDFEQFTFVFGTIFCFRCVLTKNRSRPNWYTNK